MGLEIPMRDLRLMDPALQAWEAYAQLLVRDNALVFSVEHVRLIIGADKVRVCVVCVCVRAARGVWWWCVRGALRFLDGAF